MRKSRSSKGGAGTAARTITAKLTTIWTGIAAAGLLLMTIAISLDGVGRYLLGAPLAGSVETVTYVLLPAGIWFAMAHTERTGGHVRVRFLIDRLPEQKRLRLSQLTQLIGLLLLIGIFIASVRGAMLRSGGAMGGVLDLPAGPIWSIIPIALSLFIAIVAIDVFWPKQLITDTEESGIVK